MYADILDILRRETNIPMPQSLEIKKIIIENSNLIQAENIKTIKSLAFVTGGMYLWVFC